MAIGLKDRSLNGSAKKKQLVDVPEFRVQAPPGQPKKRRGGELLLAGLLIGLSVVGVLALLAREAEKVPVLVMARDVGLGEVVTDADLVVGGVSADLELASLAPVERSLVVGGVALAPLSKGAVLSPGLVSAASSLVAGNGVVGLALVPGQYPAEGLSVGDSVVAVYVDSRVGRFDPAVDPELLGPVARVVAVSTISSGRPGVYVSLELPEADAARVGAAHAVDAVLLVKVPNLGAGE